MSDEAGLLEVLQSHVHPSAEFAYVDDSGDPGWHGSKTFGLGCVIVPVDYWTTRLDMLQEMRRGLRKTYGLRVRDEVKGEWLASVKKQFRRDGYGDGQLRDIYRTHLNMAALICSKAFAVMFVKSQFSNLDVNLEAQAWEFLLQRLRVRSERTGAPIVLVHDNGSNNAAVRAHVRRFRRFSFKPGGAHTKAPLLVEDPVPRDSSNSYFVQLADLVAYAASRRVLPPRGRTASICGPQMWEQLGDCRAVEVSNTSSDGIVRWHK